MEDRLLNLPKLPKWWNKKVSLLFIVLLSTILHAWTVWQLPQDFDEPVYLEVASDYADLIRQKDFQGLLNYEKNQEHPALVKLLYSIPYLMFENPSSPNFYLFFARGISAFFGVLASFMIALINPWAGLFISLHSMTLKYTSQAYLEALPLFLMIFSIYTLIKSEKGGKWWFYLSAVSVGLIAASKYPYLMVIIVLAYIWSKFENKNIFDGLKFLFTVMITFLIFNFSLWINPIENLLSSLFFHGLYSQSTHVQSQGYPWYQPLIFLSTSVQWHPQVFFFFTSDEFVFYVTIFGLYFEIKEKRWTAVWFFIGLLVLLIWPTKWPQYTLLLTPVLCLIAGFSIDRAWNWIKPRDDYWNYLEAMLPKPPKITWWIIGFLIIIVSVGKVNYEYQLALARRGWSSFNTTNSPLESNVINQIVSGQDDEIVFATNNGFQIWNKNEESLWGNSFLQFDSSNSPLPSDRITSIQFDPITGFYWIGTELGILRYDGENWIIYDQSTINCELCHVNDIFVDWSGWIWVGLNDGLYYFDGETWQKFSDPENELLDTSIFAVKRQINQNDDRLWVGSYQGVSMYDFVSNEWKHETWSDNFFGWGGVLDLYILHDNRVVANTSGGGIGIFENDWVFYKNSNAPFVSNTINTAVQSEDGSIWFGFGYSTEPGGYLMRLDPSGEWHKYFSNTSGYLEGEPLDLFTDKDGRLWVATNGSGLQTFYRETN